MPPTDYSDSRSTAFQAEVRSRPATSPIDFWRFNVHYARQILEDQPIANSPGIWNQTDHRPLEGFVYAITPFNFTAIAGNLPTAPALMGNTVDLEAVAHPAAGRVADDGRCWRRPGCRPASSTCSPATVSTSRKVALTHPDLAGIHFTGSTPTFQHLWQTVGENIASYRSYPRIVGETGGKDFILAHPSADPDVLRVAMIRGSFEFQGQKCSAASRAYVPRSVWNKHQGRPGRPDRVDPDGRRHRLLELHGRRHRRPGLRQAQGRDRPRPPQQPPHRCSPAARPTTRSATSCRPTIVHVHRPDRPDVQHRVLRPDPGRARVRRRALRPGPEADGVVRAVRPDRLDHRPGPPAPSPTPAATSASPPATSTSTTSPPVPSSASSPSVARVPQVRTTRPAPPST